MVINFQDRGESAGDSPGISAGTGFNQLSFSVTQTWKQSEKSSSLEIILRSLGQSNAIPMAMNFGKTSDHRTERAGEEMASKLQHC